MISEKQMQRVLEQALSTGADFAELFFEDKDELNVKYLDQVTQGVTAIRLHGAGLYVLAGRQAVYVHTNNTTEASLLHHARRAAELILQAGIHGITQPARLCDRPVVNPNKAKIHPSTVDHQSKICLLAETDQAARSSGTSLARLAIDYFDTDQRIVIANSDGLLTGESRVTVRLRLQVTVSDGGRSFFNWEDLARAQGYEAFRDQSVHTDFARDLVVRTRDMMRAGSVASCTVPVVLEAGSCGTLWHESCGHALEASAIAARSSAFIDKIGRQVAATKVTLVDDGSVPGMYGSSAIDDEGQLRRKNVLIENGVLRQYLCDRFHGQLIGQASTGSGRRQNYTYAPTSRMSNTYLAAGQDDEDEIIRSIPDGLYVRRIGGGTGGMQFSLEVKEGFWIKNGQLDRPVKGLTLTGNGIDVIRQIDRVGKRLVHENSGGFCGAGSGLIPTTTSQPRVRIAALTIGGEGNP